MIENHTAVRKVLMWFPHLLLGREDPKGEGKLSPASILVTWCYGNPPVAVKARAAAHVEAAVTAGRIAPNADTKTFWQESLIRDEPAALKALETLPINPVLAKVTDGDDPKSGLLDKMQLQQKKLAEVQAAHPGADFQTIFAKAQTEAPDLFR